MDIEHIYSEPRCRICTLDPQIRKIIDDLLLKGDQNLDTIYFYLSGICRTYGLKTPSRSSLKRHADRHVRKEIDFKELRINPGENLISGDILYEGLMFSIAPVVNETEFKPLYSVWITEWSTPLFCSAEEFHRRLKIIFSKALPDRCSELLKRFTCYVEQHTQNVSFKWSDEK